MIDITFEAEDVVLKFPKRLVSSAYLQNFLEKLRLEMLAMKSLMTEEQVWELSEEVKQQWWDKNKEAFLNRVRN
ncbi:hypothetical protein L0244_03080 [bacterium]|nr:hypothetical protein [bacterium]